jgi:hypothetical protein
MGTRNLLIILLVTSFMGSAFFTAQSSAHSSLDLEGTDLYAQSFDISPRIRLIRAQFNPLRSSPDISVDLRQNEHNGFYIIQCKDAIQPEWLATLETLGVRILNYLPDYAYVVFMESDTKVLVEDLPFVRWVGYYHPYYKISPELDRRTGIIELNVVVFDLDNGEELGKVADSIMNLGGLITHDGRGNSIIRTRIDASMVKGIAAIPGIAWIDEYSEPVAAMDDIRDFTGADTVHVGGFNGSGIVGEVKDNGFDSNHPDFAGQIAGTDGSPVLNSHGTATFGIVFSSGANSARAKGMLFGGDGVFASWSVGRKTSIENLVNNWDGVFQSNSWHSGSTNGAYSSYSRENDQAIFENDITMLYAAGNGGGTTTISQDASAKNVIAVGGLLHYNNADRTDDDHVNGDSGNQGPTADGRIKPDLCGPYDRIYTTDVSGSGGYTSGDYYGNFGGTSGATPVAAGATGLVYQMYEENHFGNNQAGERPHASTVKALLIANAYQYDFTQADRYEQGWGLVDVSMVYSTGIDHLIVDEDVDLQTGQNVSYDITPIGTQPLKITLVWTDPAALASANPALINNLNLKVTAPDGTTTYWGNNGLDSGKWSVSGGSSDTLNNVENVFIQTANPSDIWRVEVIAQNIAEDGNTATPAVDQHFALVVAGGVVEDQPPMTTHIPSGTQGSNGWFLSPVSVTLNATDNHSGIAFTNYSLDGSPWIPYADSFLVTGEGQHTIEYYSTDTFGNAESVKTATIKIDTARPEYSSPSPIGEIVHDSDMNHIRLEIDWTDATSGMSEVRFRHRFGAGSWSGWNDSTSSSGDTYWYDVPRASWINQTGEQLDWESNGTDMAGLSNATSSLDGMSILDDDTSAPYFSNPSSDGNILDSNLNPYKLQIDWSDDIGFSEVEFRYSNDTIAWSPWDIYTGISGNTYSYEIPRTEWIKSVGKDLYWQSRAKDNDDDRTGDSLENGTATLFAGSIADDDVDPPTYMLKSHGNIYDNDTSDYLLSIDWFDDTPFSYVEFRYRYDSDPWSSWHAYSGNSGDTYWYAIPRTEWIERIGARISWESRASDDDNDRNGDSLEKYTGLNTAGWIFDDDLSPPILINAVAIYNPESLSYCFKVTAVDPSGWTVYVEYNYSDSPTLNSLGNSVLAGSTTTLTVEIDGSELDDHVAATISWRYRLEDNDSDRTGDSIGTTWSDWYQSAEIDLQPPTTTISPSGEMVNSGWYIGQVTIALEATDDISGVDYTMFGIDNATWSTYGSPFEIVESGIFKIEYYSVDKAGNAESIGSLTLSVDNSEPISVSGTDTSILKDTTLDLDGSDSSDDVGIQSYEWKIEKDGNVIAILHGSHQTYLFAEPGDYGVTLTVWDQAGNTDESDFLVHVTEPVDDRIFDWWLILVIPIIIVIIILMAFFVRRRRKKEEKKNKN